MFSCCACAGRTDNSEKRNADNDTSVGGAVCVWYEAALYDDKGNYVRRVGFTDPDGESAEPSVKNLVLNRTYYIELIMCTAACAGDWISDRVSYDNPVEYVDGEIVKEPVIVYDSEYLQVVSVSNPVSCCYMVKGIKLCGLNDEQTTKLKFSMKYDGDYELSFRII